MDETELEHSVASQISYDYETFGLEKAQDILEKELPGYKIDPALTDDYSTVIIKPDGSAIVSYRGTDLERPDDIMADIVIFSGLYKTGSLQYITDATGLTSFLPASLTRFSLADQKYKNVIDKYEKVSITGHSLGGSQAKFISKKYDTDAYVFNPGSVPNLPGEQFSIGRNTKVLLVEGDTISRFVNTYTPKEQIKYIKQTQGSAHSLKNFTSQKVMREPMDITEAEINNMSIEDLCELYPQLKICEIGS
jgi:hypothetical protein